MVKPQTLSSLALATLLASQAAPAVELYADEDSHLNADMLAVWGMFNSRKNYDGTTAGPKRSGRSPGTACSRW